MSRHPDRQRAARYVAARRAALGLTQDELAERAEIDPKTVWNLERGERWPRTGTRSKLEAALGWDEGDIHLVAEGGFPSSGPLPNDDPDGLIQAAGAGRPLDEFGRRVQEVVASLPPHEQAIMSELLASFEDVQRQNQRLRDRLAALPSPRDEGNGSDGDGRSDGPRAAEGNS